MPFVQITAAQTDADSPVDQALMDTVRLNFDDHETRLLTFTPADGTVTTPKIVDANVTLAKLKMAQGSWTGILTFMTPSSNITMHRYSHIYQGYDDGGAVLFGPPSAASWTNGIKVMRIGDLYSPADIYTGLSWDYHTN